MTVSSVAPVAASRVEESSGSIALLSDNMSLTYAEFIHPVGALESNDDQNNFYLPSNLPFEFQVIEPSPVPLLQNAEDCDHDFIVIAEFSELEGPVPLCTIPFNAPSKTDINLSSLAVHLMSTDYQVNSVGHFKICQDTQVMRKNVFKNVHVFMQYFTLYDIKARGFVRPFCFGYVSKDHVKMDKHLSVLITEFDRHTQILKQANRQWFANELSQYLDKLRSAKDNFLQDFVPKNEDRDPDVFYFAVGEGQEDPDAITLNQIAHQYSEIENILRIVKAAHDPTLESKLLELCSILNSNQDTLIVSTLIEKMKIPLSPDFCINRCSSESIDIPLLHPLKIKGENLRPLTTLGQLGVVILIWKLIGVYKQSQCDAMFSEMDCLTSEFRILDTMDQTRAANLESSVSTVINATTMLPNFAVQPSAPISYLESRSVEDQEQSDESQDDIENAESTIQFLFTEELNNIIEKLHSNLPVVSDNGSGSYHTVSEDESDINNPVRENGNDNENSSCASAFGSVENCNTSETEPRTHKLSTSSDPVLISRSSVSSFSSDEETSSNPADTFVMQVSSEEEIIKKVPWWESASQKLTRGCPGYGLLKFIRHYHKLAHHLFFSILIGRPIIICAEERRRSKVATILSALTPLVPCYPETHWKLLKWHRGILVKTHLTSYKLIGLCIPERLNVLDLIHARDQNVVTIFNVDRHAILGPAYQGNFFQSFENASHNELYQSDASVLTYIGSILSEIETKIFMFKSLEERNVSKYFKQLNLRSSDVEIVRFLGNMVGHPDHCVDLF